MPTCRRPDDYGAAAPRSQGNKKRGTTLPLTSFLKPDVSNWADDDPDSEVPPALPTAPGGQSTVSYETSRRSPEPQYVNLPSKPPFKVFVGNLDYNVSAQELGEFFHTQYEVVDVLLLKHEDTGNVRGAFVEFRTVEDLQGALSLNGKVFKNRSMRVDVASDRPNRGQHRQWGGDDRPRRSFDEDRQGGYGERNRYGDRGYPRGGFHDRSEQGLGGVGSPPSAEDRGGFGGDRRPRDRGGFSGAPKEEMEGPRWGHKHVPEPALPQPPPQRPQEPPAPPAERKRLVLAPRSKPAEGDAAGEQAHETPETSDKPKRSNPFGNAKPVDATARLQELEEKIAKQKAEEAKQRDKAAQEKAAAAKAKAEQRAAEEQQAAEMAADIESSASSQALPPPPPIRPPSQRGPPPPQQLLERHSGGAPPPPAGSGRGGPGPSSMNGQPRPPAGSEGGRGELSPGYGRGRRGRGREGRGRFAGDGRGEHGRGRGASPTHAYPQRPSNQPVRQAQPVPGRGGRGPTPQDHGFQEAGPKAAKGRTRGWETHTPASAASLPPPPGHSGSARNEGTEGSEASKVTNMFDMLGTSDE